MVAGQSWPDGDPYLQRQNEPSIAVSSRNELHLLAGANDYRTVDLPGLVDKATGDAWLGLFKSFDGGQTWKSTLLPGYPQDTSAIGLASPLKAYDAGADATVRAGSNGLLFFSGIAFQRGAIVGNAAAPDEATTAGEDPAAHSSHPEVADARYGARARRRIGRTHMRVRRLASERSVASVPKRKSAASAFPAPPKRTGES